MFRQILPLLLILTVSFLPGCQSAETQSDVLIEMLAFSSLTEEEQQLIPASPKDSTVRKVMITEEIQPFIEKSYDQDEIYSVTFHNTESNTDGDLTVFVDLEKRTVVGKGSIRKP
ncbi:hypothetical protein [Sporosarcina sp. Te-1]|uniref:hypothetical protein n=1 Tax=Sporosarcina sp. Te-1 TaxID=2818390 RepID=UPI001A9FBAD4|nr:hypothetical protein [Sporosarcina sp. Te-1]QTD42127.1 hypothetical protein J3U78_04690 [Sporosarcina sp. Te-1]